MIKQLLPFFTDDRSEATLLGEQKNRPAHPLLPQIHSLWTEKSQRRRFTDAEGVLNSTDGCFLPQQPHFNKYTFILYYFPISQLTCIIIFIWVKKYI